ncbi:CHASE3 domain-containing protein [Mesorhizobium sp. VNQ89]|uniref:sensor histidine kinase n=1 Tax=Mesorhizobium quangtriensis TaxID=3157709 RepID=UPI0032B86F05
MPFTSRSVLQWTSVLFGIGVLALLAILIATGWLISTTIKNADQVVEARETRAAIVDLKSLVQDAEIGQRGFLLTGRETYLQPFERAKAEIPARFQALSHRLADEVSAQQISDLSSKIDAKMEELSLTISLFRDGKQDEARAIVDSDRGKAVMDEARALFDNLTAVADRRFSESVFHQRTSAQALQWIEIIGAIVILAVVGGAAWLVTKYTRDLLSARDEIEALNVGLEEKVQNRTVELGRANEEIQRFAYIVTHDLRAPLVNIMGFTSELENSLVPLRTLVTDAESDGRQVEEAKLAVNEDVPEAIGFIRSSTNKMDGLINAILKLSREGRRQLKPERIDLRTLLQSAVDVVQHQVFEAGGEAEIDTSVTSIQSDRLVLEQVIGNLLDNAVKYAAADRPLHIKLRAKPTFGNRVVIEVEDNGRGIAEQDHQRVFDLFRRSGSQDKPGEGIGLAHVRSSIRSLGGDITLSSSLGTGSTFRIDLPSDLSKFLRSAGS